MNAISNDYSRERGIMRRLVTRCSPHELARRIDVPLDRRFLSYRPEPTKIRQPSDLVSAGARLLYHLDPAQFPKGQGEIYVARVIEEQFEGGIAVNFASFCDGTNGGMRMLYLRIVEELKRERRALYVQGILRSAIDPSDGPGRLRAVRALLKEYSLFNRSNQRPAEEFANRLPDLVLAIGAMQSRLKRGFAP